MAWPYDIAWHALYWADEEAYADGAAVTQLTDLSGNARHGVQATSSKRATFDADALNGRAAYRFGGDDYYDATFTTLAHPFTVVVLAQMMGGGQTIFASIGNTAGNAGLVRPSTSGLDDWIRMTAGTSVDRRLARKETEIHGCIFNGASSVHRYGPYTEAMSVGTNPLQNGLRIGALSGGSGSLFANGPIYFLGLYNGVLSTSQLDAVFAGLRAHYNLPTKFAVAAYDTNEVVEQSAAIYTPLWSSADRVYLAVPMTRSGVTQSRVIALDPDTYAQLDEAQLLPTGIPHDGNVGHRPASVAVTAAGTIVAHPHGHGTAWNGSHSTTPHNLSTLTPTTAPALATARAEYRRFFRNPHTGDTWLVTRGNTSDVTGTSGAYKWNEATKIWDLMVKNEYGYGAHLAFASDGTVYMTTETLQPQYPRRDIGLIKSTGGGVTGTWTNMLGVPTSNTPYPSEATLAFPSPVGIDNATGAIVALGPEDIPVVFAQYSGTAAEDTYMSLWQAIWDEDAGVFVRSRLVQNPTGNVNTGHVQADDYGVMYVTTGTNRDDGGDVVLLRSQDGAQTWDTWTLGTGTYHGAFLDRGSIQEHGKIRLYAVNKNSATVQIWESPEGIVVPPPIDNVIVEDEVVAAVYKGGSLVSRIYKGSTIVFGNPD